MNGVSPFDVYTCDTGYTTCVYIDTIVSGQIPYSFTIPVATQSTQVRTYIDGVRQFESEYSLNLGANTITFTTTPDNGSKVLIEVDGYYVNPYYANNITFTAPFGNIVSSANTIQLAIQDLETRKAALAGATYTGVVSGITIDTNASNTAFATTAYVQNLANNSGTLTTNITGNAGTVTNGVYTSSSYENPSWLTAIAPSKLNDVIPDDKLADKVTAGDHGNGTANTLSITVDAKGRVTAISNSAISIKKSQISDFPTLATSATTDTTDAANITKGTLPSARLGDSGAT